MKNKGLFISFSGIDGSGKSTYIKHIEKYLQKKGVENLTVCDGLKPCTYNEKLQMSAKAVGENVFDFFNEFAIISYAIDLIKNLEYIVHPQLEEKKIVITHRNDLCCKAYSMVRDSNDKGMRIINRILKVYPKPDLHFYLDVDPRIAVSRVEERSKKTGCAISISENYETLTKIRENYFKLIDTNYTDVVFINTGTNTQGDIQSQIEEKIDVLLNSKLSDYRN